VLGSRLRVNDNNSNIERLRSISIALFAIIDRNGVFLVGTMISNPDEARDMLRIALSRESMQAEKLADSIRARIEPLRGIKPRLPEREPIREPPAYG
jgi:hypothetical protein